MTSPGKSLKSDIGAGQTIRMERHDSYPRVPHDQLSSIPIPVHSEQQHRSASIDDISGSENPLSPSRTVVSPLLVARTTPTGEQSEVVSSLFASSEFSPTVAINHLAFRQLQEEVERLRCQLEMTHLRLEGSTGVDDHHDHSAADVSSMYAGDHTPINQSFLDDASDKTVSIAYLQKMVNVSVSP